MIQFLNYNLSRHTRLKNPLSIEYILIKPLKSNNVKDVNALKVSPSISNFIQCLSHNIYKDQRYFNSIDMSSKLSNLLNYKLFKFIIPSNVVWIFFKLIQLLKNSVWRDIRLENPLSNISTLTQPLKLKYVKDINELKISPPIFNFLQPSKIVFAKIRDVSISWAWLLNPHIYQILSSLSLSYLKICRESSSSWYNF